MKNSNPKPILGIVFVMLGVLLAARVFGLLDYISFNGWWTLFIIIPCLLGLFQGNNPSGSFLGLGIGVILFLGMNQVISWRITPQLLAALIFSVIGLSYLFKDERIDKDKNKKSSSDNTYRSYDNQQKAYESGEKEDNTKQQGDAYQKQDSYDNNKGSYSSSEGSFNNSKDSYNNGEGSYNSYQNNNSGQGFNKAYGSGRHNQYNAVLSSRVVQLMEEEFKGCTVTSILGNLQLDLRNAIIKEDVVVDVTCLLGGLDIFVPSNAKVSVSCTPILGGVENRVSLLGRGIHDTVTIYIRGTCVLGGIEIR